MQNTVPRREIIPIPVYDDWVIGRRRDVEARLAHLARTGDLVTRGGELDNGAGEIRVAVRLRGAPPVLHATDPRGAGRNVAIAAGVGVGVAGAIGLGLVALHAAAAEVAGAGAGILVALLIMAAIAGLAGRAIARRRRPKCAGAHCAGCDNH